MAELTVNQLSCGCFVNPFPPSYIQCASVVGLYSVPCFHRLVPSPHNTPLTHVIANILLLLILTSALPLTSKTLGESHDLSRDYYVMTFIITGITQFCLLGWYQTTPWLSHTGLMFWYNSLFLVLTTFTISRRVSKAILREASKLLATWLPWQQQRKSELSPAAASNHNHSD